MRDVIHGNLRWVRDLDGEYNERTATTSAGVKLTVASNYDGDDWMYRVGDGELTFGCQTMYEAMDAAIAAAAVAKEG